MSNATKVVGAVVVIIILVLAIGLYTVYSSHKKSAVTTTVAASSTSTVAGSSYTTSVPSSQPSNQSTPVMVTDPSHVPAGTQATVITYSQVMVHTTGSSGGWVERREMEQLI